MKTFEQYLQDHITQQEILLQTNLLTFEHNCDNGLYDDNRQAKKIAKNQIQNQRQLIKSIRKIQKQIKDSYML